MLTLPASVRLYVAAEPVDLRKGFDSLARLARHVLAEDPMSGHIFLYYNRRRNRLKALWWDRTGYVLLYKRLERGTFPIPTPASPLDRRVEIDSGQFHLLLEGFETAGLKRKKRWQRSPHKTVAPTIGV